MADQTVALALMCVLLAGFLGWCGYVVVPPLRGLLAEQTGDVADQVALLQSLPLDLEPFDYAAGVDRLLTAAAAAPHSHHKPKGGTR